MRSRRLVAFVSVVVGIAIGVFVGPAVVGGRADAANSKTFTYFCGRNGDTDAGIELFNRSAARKATVHIAKDSQADVVQAMTITPRTTAFFPVDHNSFLEGT